MTLYGVFEEFGHAIKPIYSKNHCTDIVFTITPPQTKFPLLQNLQESNYLFVYYLKGNLELFQYA